MVKRMFFVDEVPETLLLRKQTFAEVSYLCLTPAIVMAQKGEKFYLGEVKDVSSFDIESLKEIPATVYAALVDAVKASAAKINVYEVNLDSGKVVRINSYLEENQGKKIAEVSFDSEADASVFDIPDWFGTEIHTKRDLRVGGFSLKNKPIPNH